MHTNALGLPPDLEALFDAAESNGLWFFCSYQQLWFSPEKLREEMNNGRFRWGAVNWKLRDPNERVLEAQHAAKAAQLFLNRITEEIDAWRKARRKHG